MSRTNQPPLSLIKLARFTKGKEDKIAVVVGTVTDDARLLKFPKLTVCALRFTEGARTRILKAGGEILTFDQLALRAPTGANTVLLRGRKTARKATKHFGAPGVPNSTTRYNSRANSPSSFWLHLFIHHTISTLCRPKVANRSRKTERARGRRKSVGFKV